MEGSTIRKDNLKAPCTLHLPGNLSLDVPNDPPFLLFIASLNGRAHLVCPGLLLWSYQSQIKLAESNHSVRKKSPLNALHSEHKRASVEGMQEEKCSSGKLPKRGCGERESERESRKD